MRRRSAVDETPRAGPTKIARDTLKHGIMDGSRSHPLNIDRGATSHCNNGHAKCRTALNRESNHAFYLEESCMCKELQG